MKRVFAVILAFVMVFAGAVLPAAALQVFVVTSSGKVITLDVDPSNEIENVKSKIEEREGIPIADQILSFNGLELADNRTVSDYSIEKGNTLVLAVRTPAVYAGPVFEGLSAVSAEIGKRLTLKGSRLASISSLRVAGVEVEGLVVTETELSFIVPNAETGMQSMLVSSAFGLLSVQDALRVLPRVLVASYWTKKLSDSQVKLYAKNVVGVGKVQFFFNGKEIAWVRAIDATDPKLRTAAGSDYLVRTVNLVAEQKNTIEVFVEQVRVTRVAHTY
jgi:large subunit ribosomal protein L40e